MATMDESRAVNPAPENVSQPGPAADSAGMLSRAEIEARLRWLAARQEDLARSGRRMPWLLLFGVAAIPAGILWGPFAVIAVLVAVASIPLMGAYIVWSHREEYAAERKALRQLLAEAERTGGAVLRRRQPWRVPGKPLAL
jgi:hypothetical protein